MGQLAVINNRIVYETPRSLRIVQVRVPVNRQRSGKSVDRHLSVVVVAMSAELVKPAIDEPQYRLLRSTEVETLYRVIARDIGAGELRCDRRYRGIDHG